MLFYAFFSLILRIGNMDDNFVLVEYLSNINNVVKQTFQSMQRIKLVCFNSSPSYLVFGATSGGIYIFKRDPCEFLKLIPSKEGSANLIAISKDERHIGIASSKGLVLILENFIEDAALQYQVFSEHEGRNITYIKWHQNELYVGDEKGKISVISIITALFPTKSLFQIPTATLMTLDSSIVQIDIYQCYLLISTKTRTYLCNTEKESYIQIGKKLRDGYFGACFCNTSNDVGEIVITQNTRGVFRSMKESEVVVPSDNANARIFCARPGVRLWEAGFDAKVMVTYQFKSSLKVDPTGLLIIGCEEESVLDKRAYSEVEKVPDNFNFRKIYPVCDKFVFTYDSDRLYIFDPPSSKLVFWTSFSNPIKQVAFMNNNFYVWKDNLEIIVLSVVELEHLILSTLYKKQYYLCTDICLEFRPKVLELLQESKQLYLLSVLKSKITSEDLLDKLQPILDKVKESNEKVLIRKQKGNIVLVENLYLNEEVAIPPQKVVMVEDENKEYKMILKQYKLNKTYRTIEIPEVMELLDNLDGEALFVKFKQFTDYVTAELSEDATDWCQDQYLKQISKRCIPVKDLPNDSFEFLTRAVINANKSINFSCRCGYPLPKCHKYAPKFYKTALDIFKLCGNVDQILKTVPYLWMYRVKTEIYGLNLTALLQFSHRSLFRQHTMQLTYDSWHDVLGYFVKINKGLCLNCDRTINIESLLTWTELAKVIVQSLGAKNTIKILEKYEKVIPNGALDPTFYQSCVFAHSFNNDNNVPDMKSDAPFKFMEGMDKAGYLQFQNTMAKYFKRKYIASKNPSYAFSTFQTGACLICNLPLKNDILCHCETVKSCGHKFHKFCFVRGGNICNVCN